MVLWRPTRPSRSNTQKRCPFHYVGLECKSRKSRDTWSNRQVWPWSIKWRRSKANRVLSRECTGCNKYPLPTTQEKILHMDITRWSTHFEIRLIIFFAAKDREALHSQQKQDQELTVAQITNSLLPNSDLNWRNGKTTRPFRYDLNQIPYDYTVEVRNRFKGLGLIECLMNYGWRFMTIVEETGVKTVPKKKKCKKAKWLCEEAL